MLTGLLGRIAYAILAAVVTFLVVFVIVAIIVRFDGSIGQKIESFVWIIGLLVGIIYFVARPTPRNPIV